MYSRAPRITYDLVGGTEANVGPGSYEVNQRQTRKPDCYAPFMSMCSRETIFRTSFDEMESPGPGQYEVTPVQGHVLGGHSLQNRSRRFEEKVSEIPGPGAYDVVQGSVMETDQNGRRMSKPGVPSLLKSLRQPDIPSIPSPGQAFGYEESGAGILCRQPPPPKDDTLGPAFYCPRVADSFSTLKYKGVHFGKMTGKRGEMKVAPGPGPGEYSPEESPATLYENVNLKRESRDKAELVLPRYHEIVTLQEEKKVKENWRGKIKARLLKRTQMYPSTLHLSSPITRKAFPGVPGPGQYDIKSQFERTDKQKEGQPAVNTPFLFQAQRFIPLKEEAPPVGLYDDPRSSLDALKKVSGLKKSPFGQTAVRFTPARGKLPTPGPGAYDMFNYGMAQESLRRAQRERNQGKPGFGSGAARKPAFVRREEPDLPGPGQYKVERKLEELYKRKHTAAFMSVTERLMGAQGPQETPPPSSYNVQDSFEKMRSRSCYMPPRNEGARKRQSCFLSAAPRTSTFRPSDPEIPGPGQYSPAVSYSPKTGLMVSKEARFRDPRHDAPSPTAYELSPAIMDTVLRGTFNVTLDNPLATRPHAPVLKGHCGRTALALTSS